MHVFAGHSIRSGTTRAVVIAAVVTFCSAPVQPQTTGQFHPPIATPPRGLDTPTHAATQAVDVLHYRLDLAIPLDSDSLSGTIRMILLLNSPASGITLNAVGLRIDTSRVDGVDQTVIPDSVSESINVLLGETRNAGDTLSVELHYSRLRDFPRRGHYGYYFFDTGVGIPANLGYTFSEPSDARNWMPCHDQPWDKATAELHLTVPSGVVAASNGRLTGVSENGDGSITWHWREDHPIATYLMCFTASAFTVSTRNFMRAAQDTVPLQYFVWSEDSAESAAYLPAVDSMMRFYSTVFGPYPFDKYGMTAIAPFTFAGMEHQSLTTLNRFVRTEWRVVAHELAHQWWGDLVTCGTWSDIWLNEGFASYSEALWQEHVGGPAALRSYMNESMIGFQYGSWQGAVYDPESQGFNLFSPVVYTKAAWVLHMLRGIVGDAPFLQILEAYRARFAGGNAVTDDFRAVVDSVTGKDTRWFFDQWIFGKGWPKYGLQFSWQEDTVSVLLTQEQDSILSPLFTMPITLRVYGGGVFNDFAVHDTSRMQVFRLPFAQQPDSVVLDPEGWVLKQISPLTSVSGKEMPLTYVLHQNYPNPFNPVTTISYTLPARVHVKLEVFDVLGRRIATLADGVQDAGQHAAIFDGAALASGTYLYRLEAGTFRADRKMALVK
jgi:aminopeptidase N